MDCVQLVGHVGCYFAEMNMTIPLRWLGAVIFAVSIVIGADAARAELRIALVVGNSNYGTAGISLSNPKNDAEDVAAALEKLGFEVARAVDANKRDMERALERFGRRAIDADAA